MGDRSAIEWTDATWNPVVGCSVVSPGCKHCYAMQMAARLERMGMARYAGLTMPTKAGPVWTGTVRAAPEDTITQPLRWARPRRVFVNSMSDLFHPNVPFGLALRVWSVMARTPQHTYQILTKRPDGMLAFLEELAGAGPLPNVWLGTSAEDQPRFDERSPAMAAIAALGWATTWCSAEPLLGPLDIAGGASWLRWLVVGGESGLRARPMLPRWVDSLRVQCGETGVPFFFKQWGAWQPKAATSAEQGDLVNYLAVGIETSETMRKVGKAQAGAALHGRQWQDYPAGMAVKR